MAATISDTIIPTPVAKVLAWTKQNVSPTAAAAAAVARVTKTVKVESEKGTGLIASEIAGAAGDGTGELEATTTPAAVATQWELKERSEVDKTKRDRGQDSNGTEKKSAARTGGETMSSGGRKGGNNTPKRAKVQLKTEVKVELEIEIEDATMTQVGAYVQFQSRWEGFTLRQMMKEMVKRSTRFVRRATWFYVGRALRYAASYV